MSSLRNLELLEMINSSLFYWLYALLFVVMKWLLWHSILGSSMTLTTTNITPFATYYKVGRRVDVFWLHCIDCCPTNGGQVGDRHALHPHAAAQRIRDVLNSLGNAAATNPQILRHRYIVSVIIAWWHLICVDVNIWGRFWWCRMCRIYMYSIHVVIQP